jgi:hypothetical protein
MPGSSEKQRPQSGLGFPELSLFGKSECPEKLLEVLWSEVVRWEIPWNPCSFPALASKFANFGQNVQKSVRKIQKVADKFPGAGKTAKTKHRILRLRSGRAVQR